MNKLNMNDAEQRAKLYAETVGMTPPTPILCPDGAPSPELLAFCDETGASLDWIFCGDVTSLVRDSFAAATGAKNPRPGHGSEGYRAAHEETDLLLARMGGCVDALSALARDYDGLNCPDRQANSIVSLIHVLEEGLAHLTELHTTEWHATKQWRDAA